MVKIRVFNKTKTKINQQFLISVARKVFTTLNIKNASLNLILVDKKTIKNLNKTYRHINKPTDVLSFENKISEKFIESKDAREKYFLGEIFISAPIAKEQAKLKKHSFFKELTILFAHGILHLVGYDHEKSQKDAEFMEKIENRIVNSIF